jgi:hypothetical protein
MMKLSDDRVTTLTKQSNLSYNSYITTCGDKIYQTIADTSTVTCYTMKGEQLWEYKDVSLLQDPSGVTVDNCDIRFWLSKIYLQNLKLFGPLVYEIVFSL